MSVTCKTCKWAKWQLTASGNIRRGSSGVCTYVVQVPLVPVCFPMSFNTGRNYVWPNDQHNCPCYEALPKPKPSTHCNICHPKQTTCRN